MPALVAALRARDARLGLGESSEYGCVVVNQAAAEFQQRTGHPRFSPKISEVKATDQQRPAQAPTCGLYANPVLQFLVLKDHVVLDGQARSVPCFAGAPKHGVCNDNVHKGQTDRIEVDPLFVGCPASLRSGDDINQIGVDVAVGQLTILYIRLRV